MAILEEVESIAAQAKKKPEADENTFVKEHSRKKPRKAIPEGLSEVTVYHDINENEKSNTSKSYAWIF